AQPPRIAAAFRHFRPSDELCSPQAPHAAAWHATAAFSLLAQSMLPPRASMQAGLLKMIDLPISTMPVHVASVAFENRHAPQLAWSAVNVAGSSFAPKSSSTSRSASE